MPDNVLNVIRYVIWNHFYNLQNVKTSIEESYL